MSNGEGALVAQQRGALEIPYQNIAQFDKQLSGAMNAFYMGTEISRKRQALENQLEAMALKNQQTQFLDQIREKEYERKLDQGQQRLELMAQGRDLSDQLKTLQIEKLSGAMTKASQIASDVSEGKDEALQAGSTATDPANPYYVSTRLSILNRYPGLKTEGWSYDKIVNEHNAALRATRTNQQAERSAFLKKVASDVIKDSSVDAGAILSDPNRALPGFKTVATPDEKKQGIEPPVLPNIDPKTGKMVSTALDERGQMRTFEKDAKGNYIPAYQQVFQLQSPAGSPNPRYARIPDKDYDSLSARLKQYDDEALKIPPEMMPGTSPMPAKRIITQKDFTLLMPGEAYYFIDKQGRRHEGVAPPQK